eukprot:10197042-Alexandrium_andersonii.AAC.1
MEGCQDGTREATHHTAGAIWLDAHRKRSRGVTHESFTRVHPHRLTRVGLHMQAGDMAGCDKEQGHRQ